MSASIVAVTILVIVLIGLLVRVYQKRTNALCTSSRRLDERTALVTGGTAGMGLELAQELLRRGARVIVACPDANEGALALQALGRCGDPHLVRFELLDLSSLQSTRDFAARVLRSEERLDILINNAGVGGPTTAITPDGLNFVMQVNYYGTFLLTLLLLPLLKKTGRPGDPSRIINVSSVLHRVGQPCLGKGGQFLLTSYANSKLCVVLFSRELTKKLKSCNVVINNSDPGAVGTRIFLTARRRLGWLFTWACYVFFKTPWQGAQTALHLALDEDAGKVSGEYFKNCKLARAIDRAYDNKSASKLWEESVKLVKLSSEELEHCLGV